MPAETQVQMVDEVVLAGKLPGTPAGLGEIQFFVLATPEGHVVRTNEVIEYEYERRAVTREASEGNPLNMHIETLLEDSEDGQVVLTHTFSVVVPEGASRELAEAYQAVLADCADRVGTGLRRVLE